MQEGMTGQSIEKYDEFIQNVGNGIDTHTSRMKEDILHMLALYLKQQQMAIRESLRAEAERREQALIDEKRDVENLLNNAQSEVQERQKIVQRLVVVMGETHKRLSLQQIFRNWMAWLIKKRQRRQISTIMNRSGNTLKSYHVFTQWRLFAAARRHQGLAAAEESQWKIREAELLAQVEALKEIAEEERRRSNGLEEKMKTAFVRGVCALNKEAVQVLKGTQVSEETEEPRATTSRLYDARTTQLASARPSHTGSTTTRFDILPGQPTLTTTTTTGIEGGGGGGGGGGEEETVGEATTTSPAPIYTQESYPYHGISRQEYIPTQMMHQIAPPGPPCHVCYAPDTCVYNNKKPSTHQPFVVSVDPAAVRSYGTTPLSQRSSHVIRKAVKVERSRPTR